MLPAEPSALLDILLHQGPSDRQLRLCAIAVCRHLRPLVGIDIVQDCLDLVEREAHAWRCISPEDVQVAADLLADVVEADDGEALPLRAALQAVLGLALPDAHSAVRRVFDRARVARGRAFARHLLHCVFPSHSPGPIDPAWLRWQEGRVPCCARELDRDGDLGRLPELGNLLEAAGCRDNLLLDHLRLAAPHARNCAALESLIVRPKDVAPRRKPGRREPGRRDYEPVRLLAGTGLPREE